MTKPLAKWLLLPLGGLLVASDMWSMLQALESGDPYTWLVNTHWTTWLGLALVVLSLLLMLFFRLRPEYGVWFAYIPFVRMWKRMHEGETRTGSVHHAGIHWTVTLRGRFTECEPRLTIEPTDPDVPGYVTRRVRSLIMKGHELYLRELLRIKQQ